MDTYPGLDPALFASVWKMQLVFAAIMIASCWKIFTKAGHAGWKSLIPIYNLVVLLKIVQKPWWWILLMFFLFPIGIIWMIWSTNLLSKVFGKGVGFTLGLIFLPLIFYPILAFDGSRYIYDSQNTYDY